MISRLALIAAIAITTLTALSGCSGGGDKKVDLPAQVEKLKNPDPNIKAEGLTALAEAGPGAAKAVPQIVEALKDKDPLVRRLAGYALMEIGPDAKAALPAIKEAADKERDIPALQQLMNTVKAIDPKSAPEGRVLNVTQ